MDPELFSHMGRVQERRGVVVRTHGGLGNQIFQLLYARLTAGNGALRLIHDENYPHAFPLSAPFAEVMGPNVVGRLVSALRIPKLLERLFGHDSGVIRIGSILFLDGYFQHPSFYGKFSSNCLARELHKLALEFGVEASEASSGELHHIRLGDFFANEEVQRDYLIQRLAPLPSGAKIITNREKLVAEVIGDKRLGRENLAIVPTSGMPAEEVLRLMSSYTTIVSNDSTLAFWAACLADRKLVMPSENLMNLYTLLSGARRCHSA